MDCFPSTGRLKNKSKYVANYLTYVAALLEYFTGKALLVSEIVLHFTITASSTDITSWVGQNTGLPH